MGEDPRIEDERGYSQDLRAEIPHAVAPTQGGGRDEIDSIYIVNADFPGNLMKELFPIHRVSGWL
jgi:hypothetical protein